jgi:hypothetical protein
LVGKYVLVGLTDEDARGTVVRQRQIHGRVSFADPTQGLTIELKGANDGSSFALPPDLRPFKPAPAGEYRLRSTGEIVHDPDYLVTWIVENHVI